jgi:hypothetical protein
MSNFVSQTPRLPQPPWNTATPEETSHQPVSGNVDTKVSPNLKTTTKVLFTQLPTYSQAQEELENHITRHEANARSGLAFLQAENLKFTAQFRQYKDGSL